MEYGFAPRGFTSPGTRVLLALLLAGNIAIWFAWARSGEWLPPAAHPALRLDFLAVGQGDATLIRTPRGRAFLVDGGDGGTREQAAKSGHRTVLDQLARLRVTHLDGVVISHFHNDHFGGIVKVLDTLRVDRVWDSGAAVTSPQFQEFADLLKRRRVPRLRVRAGERLDWGEELDVQVLHPEPELPGMDTEDQDARSVVLFIRYGKGAALLPGDLDRDGQRELARYGAGLRAQVLKVPHHGSAEALFPPLLDLVTPTHAFLAAGRENPFGYPASTTLQVYREKRIRVWRSDEDGSVAALIDGAEATASKGGD